MAKQTFTVGQVLTAAQLTSLQQTAMSGGAASAKTANYVLVAADAGTAISMTSTSATTITVNTGLFAAGDTVFIQNLGTANLTITAGTATVNTAGSLILPQYDAGILYFVSASSAVFYDYIQVGAASPLTTKGDVYGFGTSDARIPIGANDTVLTADSTQSLGLKWAAPASGGFTVLASGSLPSSTELNLTSISGSYKNLQLVVRNLTTSSNQTVRVRFNGATGGYQNISVYYPGGSIGTATTNAFDPYYFDIKAGIGYGTLVVNAYDYANTEGYKMFDGQASVYNTSNQDANAFAYGCLRESPAITSIKIFIASGTFTAGTYALYGVK
jgi:hypothetical protein